MLGLARLSLYDLCQLDNLELIMTDGTELPLEDGGGGGSWKEGDKEADVSYYANFDIPIPRKDIQAIIICGITYELNNSN